MQRFRDLPDVGGLEALRDVGIEFVVVSDDGYARYMDADHRGAKDREDEFAFRQNWYRQLFAEGTLVFEAGPAPGALESEASPTVKVYRLPQRPSTILPPTTLTASPAMR